MSADPHARADIVRRAAAALAERMPSYRGMLDFHVRVFSAQEEARPAVRLTPYTLDPESVRETLAGRSALVQPEQMQFDPAATTVLFAELCRIAVDCRTALAGSARVLAGRPDAPGLLAAPFLSGDEDRLLQAAADWGVEAPDLSFFIYHSLNPSLVRGAEDLAGFLAEGAAERGVCPICGSLPALGWLSAEGERFLHCRFCWHRWPLRRLVCPFCDQSNRLSYIYTDEEPEYRIEVCDGCRKYLKTVDSRNLPRPAYPPLEQVASLHLDLKAAESGYEPALPVGRPMPSDPD
jgi:FdhE protein